MTFSASTWLACSTVVGALEVLDAWACVKPRGTRVERLTYAFAFFEFVWAGVSFMVWRRALDGLPPWLPVSYMAYVAATSAAGVLVGLQDDDDGPGVRLPRDIVVGGGLFGLFFLVACGRAWISLP